MCRVAVYWEKMNHLPVCHQLPTRQNPPELPSARQLPQGGTANNTRGRVLASVFQITFLCSPQDTRAAHMANYGLHGLHFSANFLQRMGTLFTLLLEPTEFKMNGQVCIGTCMVTHGVLTESSSIDFSFPQLFVLWRC